MNDDNGARISRETASTIQNELEQSEGNRGLWLETTTGVYSDGGELVVIVEIPDDDPFEPSRLDRIFEIVERVITAHIPSAIPIYDEQRSWSASVCTHGDNALIDGIEGGEKKAMRTSRLSEGLGPPAR